MNNAFHISKEAFKEAILHGSIIAVATFFVGFFGSLDQTDFFVNLTTGTMLSALKEGVNSTWQLFYAAVIPLVVNFARWDKR